MTEEIYAHTVYAQINAFLRFTVVKVFGKVWQMTLRIPRGSNTITEIFKIFNFRK